MLLQTRATHARLHFLLKHASVPVEPGAIHPCHFLVLSELLFRLLQLAPSLRQMLNYLLCGPLGIHCFQFLSLLLAEEYVR